MRVESGGRRNFFRTAGLTAGSLLLGGSAAWAAEAGAKFKAYEEVDPALFEGVNRAKDPANKSAMEKKHAPVITAPSKVKAGEPFVVKISVGEIIHPMAPVHYIHFAELYAGNEVAVRVEFSPQFGVPEATLALKLDRPVTLIAREYCNLHGLWESRLEIELG